MALIDASKLDLVEKVVAIKLTHIARIILEPFQIDLADTVYGMVAVLVVLAEIDAEMAVMPVRIA